LDCGHRANVLPVSYVNVESVIGQKQQVRSRLKSPREIISMTRPTSDGLWLNETHASRVAAVKGLAAHCPVPRHSHPRHRKNACCFSRRESGAFIREALLWRLLRSSAFRRQYQPTIPRAVVCSRRLH
jgi:hypothetical protein